MSKTREPIRVSDQPIEVIVKMSEGNPGALNCLMELVKSRGLLPILDLDDMNIRGSMIWVAFKDHCKRDMEVFCKKIADRDDAMIAAVNAMLLDCGNPPPAVKHGASFQREGVSKPIPY